jgi:hypothetical protein
LGEGEVRTMLLSLLVVLATGLGLVLFVWAVFAAFPVVTRVVTRSFWCRFRKQNVSAGFQEDPWSGRPVEITGCTAFKPSSAITCDKACLRLRKLDPVRDSETDAEWGAEDVLIEPRWVTADAERRLAEELFVDRALRWRIPTGRRLL